MLTSGWSVWWEAVLSGSAPLPPRLCLRPPAPAAILLPSDSAAAVGTACSAVIFPPAVAEGRFCQAPLGNSIKAAARWRRFIRSSSFL